MKANEINFNRFLEQNNTQFVIPVYQRNYDWTHTQCKILLNDIFEVGANEKTTAHFIGSIVYVHDDVYSASGIRELTIIDGQQRITTITLIYITILSIAKNIKDEFLLNRINKQYLINEFSQNEAEKLKLKPTDNNEMALKYLLRGNDEEEFAEYSRIIENFNYFKNRINKDNLEIVLNGLNKLMFVEISLDRHKDDPQKIFESLNSTGLELSEADLIRNYILMGLSRKQQDKIYKQYWEVIEKLAKDEESNKNKVSDFIRDYLTIISKNIPNKNKVYFEFKNKFTSNNLENIENVLKELTHLAKFYNRLINPKNEKDKDIQLQLRYIHKLEINVSFPFILQVYDDYNSSIIDKTTFIDILNLIQSFTWRRFIMGLPTNALNKIFMRLYEDIDKNNYLESIQISLLRKKGTQRFPSNFEISNSLKEKDVYNIKSKNRIYFLERLENHNNKEYVKIDGNTQITIEHIFPQNPDAEWKINLGEDTYKKIKDSYLNTISNLTLSGNNGSLSNKYFTKKRDMNVNGMEQGYKFSRLWLNRYISNLDKWTLLEIKERFKHIEERFVDIWEYPSIKIDETDNSEVNIFEAESPRNKKLEYALFFDQKLEIRQVAVLFKEVISQLFELQPHTFFNTELTDKIQLTKDSKTLRQALPINEIYFVEGNLDNDTKFERLKFALEIFELEDELLIKYSE